MRLIVGGSCSTASRYMAVLSTGLSPRTDFSDLTGKEIRSGLHESLGSFAEKHPLVVQGPSETDAQLAKWWLQAETLLKSAPDIRVVVGCVGPAQSLAVAIEKGVPPVFAARIWADSIQVILRMRKRHRTRVLLVSATGALSDPARFVQLCLERLGVAIPLTSFAEPPRTEIDPVSLFVAREYLKSDTHLRDLAVELEANAALMLTDPDLEPNFPALLTAISDNLFGVQKRASDARHLRADIAATKADLAATKADLAGAKKANAHLERRRVEAQARAEAAERELTELRQSLLTNRLRRVVRRILDPYYSRRDINLVKGSSLFDPEWYLRKNPDVAESGLDPVEHFVRMGGIEGRAPSPKFSSIKYLQLYPDVKAAGVNPLIHYITVGANEGRAIERAD